jgi:predicted enzyme related to lactoylglutathione lyase
MIVGVGTVSVYVNDQDRAKDFYVNKLGFELRTDQPLNPGAVNRWVEVAPKDAATGIVLYKVDENWEHYRQTIGKSQSLTLTVSDMAATHKALKGKGVELVQEPDVQPWGTYAIIKDSEGNRLIMSEPPKSQ